MFVYVMHSVGTHSKAAKAAFCEKQGFLALLLTSLRGGSKTKNKHTLRSLWWIEFKKTAEMIRKLHGTLSAVASAIPEIFRQWVGGVFKIKVCETVFL